MTVVTLSRPITAHGVERTSLTFNEPTGDDIIALGVPFTFGQDKRTSIDAAATYGYISKLASIPMSAAKKLAPADFIACFGAVAGFFGVSETTQTTSSADTTNSQDSTAAA